MLLRLWKKVNDYYFLVILYNSDNIHNLKSWYVTKIMEKSQ